MHRPPSIPFVVRLLGLTIFCLVTAEFMVAGMVPALAAALRVSVGAIGNLIALYALGMAVGGPVVVALMLALRLPHKPALLWLLALYVAGAAVAAAAGGYGTMAAGRIAMGMASAACFGVSLTLCAELVAPEARGRAASLVLAGVMLAPVFGVPATAWIKQRWGWRTSFWAVAALSVLCTAVVAWRVPAPRGQEHAGLGAELRALRNGRLWAAYATSALIIGATFAAFSYFSPIFTGVTGFAAPAIPWLLMAYGIANVAGNFVVGRLADRHMIGVLAGGLGVMVAALGAFALFAHSAPASVAAFLALGLTGVALNPAMVARVMRAAAPGPLVNTMHASLITTGLAFGTWAGGAAIDADLGLRAPLWVGLALAVAGLLSLAPAAARRA
ncbi:MFS transporter [Xylophilus sp.]|uniref:MFS transporter n=1 Tax=Xylophilus sp. TaxID=2653893 RepID=UPI0013B5B792|nr:MFS transporter [Xylophilus sp.]KAF1048555.1 MAG: Inner membrane transport protein YdhP [Xylophilus sp.]